MQCVVLAAGQGTRLRPLTYHVPKPLIKVAGKNLLEHKLDILPPEIKQIILVVGYLAEQIENHFGKKYQGKEIIYVRQKKLLGSGGAINLCKSILEERFLVMNGDDIYGQEDIVSCLKYDQAMLTQEVHGKYIGGRIKLNGQGNLADIVEGIHNREQSLVNAGLYVLTRKFFDYDLVPIKNGAEYGLPQTLVDLAQDYPVKIVNAKFWLQVNSFDDLKRAEKFLLKK